MIVPKPNDLPPNMEIVWEKLSWARVFEFWCNHAVIAPKPMELPQKGTYITRGHNK